MNDQQLTDDIFLTDSHLAAGFYGDPVRGHAQVVGEYIRTGGPDAPEWRKAAQIIDFGGEVHIGGIIVRSPQTLHDLAAHLTTLGHRLARNQVHPYRPGTPDGKAREAAAEAGELWDINDRPINDGDTVDLYANETDSEPAGAYIGTFTVVRVDRVAGVIFTNRYATLGTPETRAFGEDVEVRPRGTLTSS